MDQIKITRKLTRGLKDVSPFFVTSEEKKRPLEGQPQTSSVAAEETLTPPPVKKESLPEVYCFTIMPQVEYTKLTSNPMFLSALKKSFPEVYLLGSFELLHEPMLAEQTQESIRQLVVPRFQISDVLHPEPVSSKESPVLINSEKRMCFLLHPKFVFEHGGLFQLLDRVILNVSALSTDSIVEAYQMLHKCLQQNPLLRFSLFIEDATAEDVLEVIYERFAKITSRFLGCEIDFFGCMSENEILVNHEIMLDLRSNDRLIRDPMKIRLFQLFSNELLEVVV